MCERFRVAKTTSPDVLKPLPFLWLAASDKSSGLQAIARGHVRNHPNGMHGGRQEEAKIDMSFGD
jgi:hypothetical protein